MNSEFIKINHWLRPLSWLYGLVVGVRNELFNLNILRSRKYDIPIISVGNITVGGSGKTPHVEYLVRLLKNRYKVAVLSRGYKRRSHGYHSATLETPMNVIGDEPYQLKHKFADEIHVAVDKCRCHGIERIISDDETSNTDVILLDDAYQHRYVYPGINILLVDFNRLLHNDELLPAGRLREPVSEKKRADIVIVTKCPKKMSPLDYRVLSKSMNLYPFQELYFTTYTYSSLQAVFPNEANATTIGLRDLKHYNILLITGIALPEHLEKDLLTYVKKKHLFKLIFPDHHAFTNSDIENINSTFSNISQPKIIITTEKDQARLISIEGLSTDVRNNIYYLPIQVEFKLNDELRFNAKIISYVRKNSRNSQMVENSNEWETNDSSNFRNRSRTIIFRNNRK